MTQEEWRSFYCNSDSSEIIGKLCELDNAPKQNQRAKFAAMALQGILSRENMPWIPVEVARYSIEYADALIKELNK